MQLLFSRELQMIQCKPYFKRITKNMTTHMLFEKVNLDIYKFNRAKRSMYFKEYNYNNIRHIYSVR